MASTLKLLRPLKPWVVTQPFGTNGEYYRANGIPIKGHNGLDLSATDEQPIYAAHDGVIMYAGADNRAGLGVVIRTNETYDYNGQEMHFKTIYWHLKSFVVKYGDKVDPGDLIGYADNTGVSPATHLHFSLKPIFQGEADYLWYNAEDTNGYLGNVDPTPYLLEEYAQDMKLKIRILRALVELYKQLISLLKK